jgi:threonine synthase
VTFYSTRDPNRCPVTFREVLLAGLAPDGGLYLPARVPRADPAWRAARTLAGLALPVLGPWLRGELSAAQLRAVAEDALNFPVPLKALGDGVYVLELFHGPTLSFKDVGARTMARLMNAFLAGRGERVTILVATSGDTGSAVADGFAGLENLRVVLLYPKGKVSVVQERQLVQPRPGVRALAVAGDFDDCQRLVKAAFVDPELRALGLSSANSINLGRLLPQALYYFWAALELASRYGETTPPVFCVPSGNLGNLTAGLLAAEMGLEAGRLLAAHNANDFFPGYLRRLYGKDAFKKTVATLSNAMDVGAPSNFERLYALLGEGVRERVWGTSVSDGATLARLRATYEACGYVACPHTAVGLEAAARYRAETSDEAPLIVLATAHPAKFVDTVEGALGAALPKVPALEALQGLNERVPVIAPHLDALRRALLSAA